MWEKINFKKCFHEKQRAQENRRKQKNMLKKVCKVKKKQLHKWHKWEKIKAQIDKKKKIYMF